MPSRIEIAIATVAASRMCSAFRALLLAFFVIFGAVSTACALDATRSLSQAFHRVWQVPQGLPQATIFALRQTEDGYIWLGTPAGLIRFDGVRFTTIRNCAGVPAEKMWINDLCEEQKGGLWIATDGLGLIRWGGKQSSRITQADGLPSNVVTCVLSDRQGAVWAGTPQGLARVTSEITTYSPKDGQIVSDVRALCEAPNGKLWIGGDGAQLCVYDGKSFRARELTTLPAGESVRALIAAADGTIFVGTSAGLIIIGEGRETRLTVSDGLPNNSVLCLATGKNESIWIGTRDGFSRWNAGELQNFTSADSLSQSTVYALWEDREGSLWAGTKHGLNQFSDRRTVPFTVREGLPSNEVGPLCEDSEGTLWVGTLGAGLARYDGRHFTTLKTEDGLLSDTILSLLEGVDGALWVGTNKGLNLLRGGVVEKAYTTADGLPSNTVKCLCLDAAGNLWAGTSQGIAQLTDTGFVLPEGETNDLRRDIRAMLGRRTAGLVIATEQHGLYQCVEHRWMPFSQSALQSRDVDTFYEDPEERLWMGCPGSGLIVVDGSRSFNFTMKDGLYDNDVIGLAADTKGHLWMASSNGMSYVLQSDLVGFAGGSKKVLVTTPLRLTDSLRTYEAREGVQPCLCSSRNGRIWLATTRGLIVIDVNRLQPVLPPTPVVIEQITVNGRERDPADVVRLKPGSTNVAFDYTALSLLAPMRITFRYKLEGFDKDWIDAGSRREAFYTNLAPGTYRFRVTARNVDGNDWEAARTVDFTIEPYFYQTRWFLPTCALALGCVGWGAYRLRVRRIKEQLRAVVAERGRIARELHDTLMQGFSGVTMEMQALSARLGHAEERGALDEIIRDAANCLRDARRSVAGLRQVPGAESGLAAALEQAARQLTETRDVRIKLNLQQCPQRLPVDVEYNLLRIAQEAIANAVKHAAPRSILVGLEVDAQNLRMTVEDDGLGFANGRPETRSGHYGLIGMKERATQIGAQFLIDTEPGRGTAIVVTLPMTKAVEDAAAEIPAPGGIGVDS